MSVILLQEATGGKGPDIIVEMLANVNLQTDLTIINQGGIIVVRSHSQCFNRILLTVNVFKLN